MNEWIACDKMLPADRELVETKIDDKHGCRNIQKLKRNGRLWFFPDGSMCVYCNAPTHWRPTTT